MNEDPRTNPNESSDPIQELRDEMRRDVRGLPAAIERRPKPKPGVSPLAVVASVLGSLFAGAAGMSLYDAKTESTPAAAAPQVDVRADLQAAMAPYTQQLEKVTQAITAAQQAVTEDSKAHGLLLSDLAQTVASLQKSAETQNAAFQERVDSLVDKLAAKIDSEPKADGEAKAAGEATVAARQPIPNVDGSAVQPATAEADVTTTEADVTTAKADAKDAGDDLVEVEEKPVPATANKPERGELVIDNPSAFELKLLINGELEDIKARGVTRFDIEVGTVKTQIASLPDVVQTWDKWETVDGVKRLTIKVESGSDYYKLR